MKWLRGPGLAPGPQFGDPDLNDVSMTRDSNIHGLCT